MFELADRMLAVRLGVGDLVRDHRCWGYGACCECADCRKRDKLLSATGSSVPKALVVAQPWDLAAHSMPIKSKPDPKHQPGAYVRDGLELLMIVRAVQNGFVVEEASSGYERTISTSDLAACVLVREGFDSIAARAA